MIDHWHLSVNYGPTETVAYYLTVRPTRPRREMICWGIPSEYAKLILGAVALGDLATRMAS